MFGGEARALGASADGQKLSPEPGRQRPRQLLEDYRRVWCVTHRGRIKYFPTPLVIVTSFYKARERLGNVRNMRVRLPSLEASRRLVHPARHWLVGTAVFLLAFVIRTRFRCGFVLGDDMEEFATLRQILTLGPDWNNQLVLRFGVWLFTFIPSRIFGLSEIAFFVPTLLLSSSLSVIAYCLFVAHGHSVRRAFLQSLVVATAPFEVLMGVLHSNDLFLSWCLAIAFLALVRFEPRPIVQGLALGLLLWFAFYIKLWVVYLFPALALYFAWCFVRKRSWHGAAAFAATSAVLHLATSIVWKVRLGAFLPFLRTHAATYPVDYRDLPDLFWRYPRQLFVGSEFGTTLFGVIPYILIVLLASKLCISVWPRKSRVGREPAFARWDRLDLSLLAVYGAFFLFLNFFPNAFVFDRYYSAPRIFRYLTPLSFFMTVHVGKMLIDLFPGRSPSTPRLHRLNRPAALALAACLLCINVLQAREALSPAVIYRTALDSVLVDIERYRPPALVTDRVTAFWLNAEYLRRRGKSGYYLVATSPPDGVYTAHAHEAWLDDKQRDLPFGTALITGVGNFVFYGPHSEGFRLRFFSRPLAPEWIQLSDNGVLSYLRTPERVRLWRLSSPTRDARPSSTPRVQDGGTAQSLVTDGMRFFEEHNYPVARAHFKASLDRFPNASEDAYYFYAATFFREQEWQKAIAAFEELIAARPSGRWVGGADWHIGVCYEHLGDSEMARAKMRHVIANYPADANLQSQAHKTLASLYREQGLIFEIWDRMRHPARR